MPRILFICQGHPRLQAGGAEIAAYELFQAVGQSPGYDAFFLARACPPSTVEHDGTPFQSVSGRPREILFHTSVFDPFLQSQPHPWLIRRFFRDFLEHLQPDVVHFHHTMHLGIELLQEVRRTLPASVIVYTLHEFIPICFSQGQMVRPDTHELCDHATPQRCHQCFPSLSPADFRMRELFIKTHFNLVDVFLAPSRFLLQRYVEWGIPTEKIRFMENGRVPQPAAPPRVPQPNEAPIRGRFGFFGQINPYKGVLVLLQSMQLISSRNIDGVHLDLHGANLEIQTETFQAQFDRYLRACGDCVTFVRGYRNEELPRLMERVDWVVVPSLWWENSPLVIQEAFMHHRPVLSSAIGGMAEKVTDGTSGLHFRPNDPHDLAAVMTRAAQTPQLWERLRSGIPPVFSIRKSVEAHRSVYEELLGLRERMAHVPGTHA